jgi:hypothetical protein
LFLGPLLGSIGSGLPPLISIFQLLSHLLRLLIVLRLLNGLCLAFLVAFDAEELARGPVLLSPICKRWDHHLAKMISESMTFTRFLDSYIIFVLLIAIIITMSMPVDVVPKKLTEDQLKEM